MTNRLSRESSPYLLQHAENPVDWFPWGAEALAKARAEDKPIFLSIGYSSCHWCHVMAHESFEDEETAAYLNEHFVSIKVDREERPDLDAVYMEAVQAVTGQGGWPLSAFLAPDTTPFFGGTYFPPTPRHGMPSFRQVLEAIVAAWAGRREELARAAESVRAHLRRETAMHAGDSPDYADILAGADQELHASADGRDGGWGGAPKFPQPMVLEYLLARQTVGPQPELERDIEITLDAMAAGGIYDQLAGGFHRYSTDGVWLVPHFEKMLYDNAQIARCYVHAWQHLGKPRYRTIATETLDYLLREMTHPEGGFFSAQDADTPEGEGAYFTWTTAEVRDLLPPAEASAIIDTYGLTEEGDFEGRNILRLRPGFPTPARPDPASSEILGAARARLRAARETRPRPARDEKILAGWNGLAIAALADAAAALDSPLYRGAAEKTGTFILEHMTGRGTAPGGGPAPAPSDGSAAAADSATPATMRLFHSWKDGHISGDGFLDDHACVAEGFLALYRCTFDERWFVAARSLADALIERFDRPGGGFYDTSAGHEALISRPRAAYDSPTPTGSSMAATVLLKMAAYTGEDRYRAKAEEALASLAHVAAAAPVMAGQWLSAALLAEGPVTETAIVGDLEHPRGQALVETARRRFQPLMVVAARHAGAATAIPILDDREPAPESTAQAWVCRHATCSTPTDDPEVLTALLAGGTPPL